MNVNIRKIDVLNYPLLCKETKLLKVNSEISNLIYAGALHEMRGFFEMLQLAKLLRDSNYAFSLKIIGPGSDELIQQGQEYINKHQLNECVIIDPYMDYAMLELEYQKADIGLALLHETPNYVKSLASKLYEYMSYGIVSVASHFPLWEQLLVSADAGIAVNPMDIHEIYESVTLLIRDVNYRYRLAGNGLQAHKDHYNWEGEEKKMLKFIQQIEP
ncbi:glycosyltransferase [Listeria cornellensis]|nr:glycosyltransferase [Listeria cornellensis]